MKKSIIRISLVSTTLVIVSSLFAVTSFADTTSTGATSTGTVSTGATSTGTVSTGAASTGATSAGTASTGVNCTTASGTKAELAVIQQAFLTEMTRLINEKGAAYTRAMSLSGSQRSDAIKAANDKYRTGIQNATKIRESAKQNTSHQCKEPKKEECTTASGTKAELAIIQQAFLTEMTRLINEKGAAYTRAMSLSGSQRSDAIKAANDKYRTGIQNATKIRESAKHNKSDYQCKEPKKEDRNDRDHDKKNIKNQMKDFKKDIKDEMKDFKKDIKKSHSKKRDRK